jgi:hypothetical protein
MCLPQSSLHLCLTVLLLLLLLLLLSLLPLCLLQQGPAP